MAAMVLMAAKAVLVELRLALAVVLAAGEVMAAMVAQGLVSALLVVLLAMAVPVVWEVLVVT